MEELYFFTEKDFLKFINDDGLGFFSEQLTTLTEKAFNNDADSVLFIDYNKEIATIVKDLFAQYDYLIVSMDREKLEGEARGERVVLKS